jgi:hypothetical protein
MQQTPIATCNWPRQQCRLWKFCGSIVSGLGPRKKGYGNVLTGDSLAAPEADIGHCWRVLKDLDVTCGRFAEAS